MTNNPPGSTSALREPLVSPVPGTRVPGPEVRRPRFDTTAPRRTFLAMACVASVWAVTAAASTFRSVGMWIALSALVGAALTSVSRDRRARWLLAGALVLLPWLGVRHSPWLIWVDVVVAFTLLLTAATVRPGRPIVSGVSDLVGGWGAAARAALFGPLVVAGDLGTALAGVDVPRHRVVALGRAAVVAASVSGVVVVLLASGDALFASYLDLGSVWEPLAARVAAALSGVVLTVLVFGAFRSLEPRTTSLPSIHPTTLLVTMAGLSMTIGVYGVVQVIAATSGADYVEQRTGLSYADYARSGFFQLVAVTVITMLVLAAVRSTRRRHPATTRSLGGLAVVLTLAVLSLVTTSVVKLVVYADRFGLTMLRIYTSTFAVWLGVLAIATIVALLGRSDRWLTPAALLSVVVGAFVMNVVNPERLVAEHNIERARQGAELDLDYLTRLSDDALPTILAGFGELGLDAELDARRWCQPIDADRGWFGANRSVTAAARAQAASCSP